MFGWIRKKGKASRPNKNKAKGAARKRRKKK